MPIIHIKRYSPATCRKYKHWYFVYGDNMQHKGKAGQACIRDEDNAIGLPTKWAPGRLNVDYFKDDNYPHSSIDFALEQIETRLKQGHVVVIPDDGLGTGLAQLPDRAPKVYQYILNRIKQLDEMYS